MGSVVGAAAAGVDVGSSAVVPVLGFGFGTRSLDFLESGARRVYLVVILVCGICISDGEGEERKVESDARLWDGLLGGVLIAPARIGLSLGRASWAVC